MHRIKHNDTFTYMLIEYCTYVYGPVCSVYCIRIANTKGNTLTQAYDADKNRARRKALNQLEYLKKVKS